MFGQISSNIPLTAEVHEIGHAFKNKFLEAVLKICSVKNVMYVFLVNLLIKKLSDFYSS